MATVADILSSNNVLLAPMAGVTEAPFRAICKRLGAGLTYTEMVSAVGLHYNRDSRASKELLTFAPEEVPVAVQLFGSDPAIIAAQAAGIIERQGDEVCLIDINMGCPVNKVVSKGEGSALMRTPELAVTIVRETVSAVDVPVTVKFRAGWDDADRNAPHFAQAMQAAGAAAVAVHGRTREQFYHGQADWDVIAQVKRAVDVPVIGSGDVMSAEDAVAMLEATGADAVMVARGCQGNPWIFREARALIDRGERLAPPTYSERIDVAIEHAHALVAHGGHPAVTRMRKHISWYVAGMPGATHIRSQSYRCETLDEFVALLEEYRAYLAQKHPEAVA